MRCLTTTAIALLQLGIAVQGAVTLVATVLLVQHYAHTSTLTFTPTLPNTTTMGPLAQCAAAQQLNAPQAVALGLAPVRLQCLPVLILMPISTAIQPNTPLRVIPPILLQLPQTLELLLDPLWVGLLFFSLFLVQSWVIEEDKQDFNNCKVSIKP